MKISEEYRRQQAFLHATTDYGTAGQHYAPLIGQIVNKIGVTELLDYGSGRGRLLPHLKFDHPVKIQCYDPAIPEFAGDAIPMQMCVCIDVLEHIEPECLDEVLDDLQRVTCAVGLFAVCTRAAEKTLTDGRNAHLIQQPPAWWLPKIMARWELQTFQQVTPDDFHVIVYAKKDRIEVMQ